MNDKQFNLFKKCRMFITNLNIILNLFILFSKNNQRHLHFHEIENLKFSSTSLF